ncbi:MAG: hypothetical protein RL693_1977 [Verrucomicrobiota bacterium]
MKIFSGTGSRGVCVFWMSLVLSSGIHAADLPDLSIEFNGLIETKPGTECYDAQQPWFVSISALNYFVNYKLHPEGQPGKAGPFATKFEVFKGNSLDSGLLYTGDLFYAPGLGDKNDMVEDPFYVVFGMRLPYGIKHTDLGVKYAFRITVDSTKLVAESNESNNTYTWNKLEVPPLAKFDGMSQKPQYQQLRIASTRKTSNDRKNALEVRVKNAGNVASEKTDLQLRLKDPINGTSLLYTQPIEPIQPGQSAWFTLVAYVPFILPKTEASVSNANANRRKFSQLASTKTALVFEPKKGIFEKPKISIFEIELPTDYIVTRPFTLTILKNTEPKYYGEKASNSDGVIHIPVKMFK